MSNDFPTSQREQLWDSWDCDCSATLLNTLKTDILQIQNK